MQRIDSVRPFSGGYIAYGVSDAGVAMTVPLSEIRAGVQWPGNQWPGYYLILGKKQEKMANGKYPLLFLCEGEDPIPTTLYQSLLNDAVKMRAQVIYADQGSAQSRGQVGCYTDFFDVLGQTNVELTPAPSATDATYGVVLVREYLKDRALELPQSKMTIILGQVRAMTAESDLKDFYAFHALRFLLAGFVKYQEYTPDWSTVKTQAPISPIAWT